MTHRPAPRSAPGLALSAGLLSLLLALGACTANPPAAEPVRAQPARPNIILILADDLGYGDLGAYNPESRIPTPHLDALAAAGVRFTDAHSPSAVCTPTRYGLLTGRYSWRTPMTSGVLNGYSPSLIDTTRLTLPRLLAQHGYATAGVGKWHLGLGDRERTDYAAPLRPGPTSLGFQHFFGIPASLDMEPYLYFEDERVVRAPSDSTPGNHECCFGPFWRAGAMSPGFRHDQVLPITGERAVRWIEQQGTGEQPFFLYVALAAPHTPWLPSDAFRGRSGAGEYGDFTMEVDALVGDIVAAVDRGGIADRTLVIFTSDNGAIWSGELIQRFGHRANHFLRGQKGDAWEGGHRVPFIARWPGRIPAGSASAEVISLTDVLATTAAVAGASLPPEAGEDSYNILPAMLGQARGAPIREATVHHSSRGMFAIRQGPWKLIEGTGSGGFTRPEPAHPDPMGARGQLYNLQTDPGETRNLYLERPEVVQRLQALLDRYREQGRSRPLAEVAQAR